MVMLLVLQLMVHPGGAVVASDGFQPGGTILAEIDGRKLKGEPSRLAWSPDGKTLYLQMTERDDAGKATVRHYLVPASGGQPTSTSGEPVWAAEYWGWKSGQASPADPALKIQVDEQRKIVRATAAPRGGALAGMGGDAGSGTASGMGGPPGTSDSVDGPGSSQNVVVRRMLLNGEVIGEFVNAGIVPGLTFGWAPPTAGGIAFRNTDGRIVVMNADGTKQTVSGSKNATLPAWSADASRLAWIEQSGRNKYVVRVADTPE